MSEQNRKVIGRDYAAAIDQCANREAAARYYADALGTYGPDGLDWKQVNGAILARWSPSGLAWIKARAWKYARDAECQHVFESNPGMHDTSHPYCVRCGVAR